MWEQFKGTRMPPHPEANTCQYFLYPPFICVLICGVKVKFYFFNVKMSSCFLKFVEVAILPLPNF